MSVCLDVVRAQEYRYLWRPEGSVQSIGGRVTVVVNPQTRVLGTNPSGSAANAQALNL